MNACRVSPCRGLVPGWFRWYLPLVVVATALWAQPAAAARAVDLYTAEVPAPAGAEAAFDTALAAVLVKVTGRTDAADWLASLPASRALVQQYGAGEAGTVRVRFDPVAVRRAVDAVGLPVWGEERPAVLTWLATDDGRGARQIVSAADGAGPPGGTGDDPAARLRDVLLDAAAARGLPLVLPLIDAEDLGRVTFTDLWGDFLEPVAAASSRYRADALLIGRIRSADPANAPVRWSLVTPEARFEWTGSVADGPAGAAERLAAQLASSADGLRPLRVRVEGIGDIAAYGRVYRYLVSLAIVERCAIDAVAADAVSFSLILRGDADRLLRTLALRRLLEPVPGPAPDAERGVLALRLAAS